MIRIRVYSASAIDSVRARTAHWRFARHYAVSAEWLSRPHFAVCAEVARIELLWTLLCARVGSLRGCLRCGGSHGRPDQFSGDSLTVLQTNEAVAAAVADGSYLSSFPLGSLLGSILSSSDECGARRRSLGTARRARTLSTLLQGQVKVRVFMPTRLRCNMP